MVRKTKRISDLTDKLCNVCGTCGYSDRIVTCSKCNNSEHLYCMKKLKFKVPPEWTCHMCSTSPTKKEHLVKGSSKPLIGKVKFLELDDIPLRIVRKRRKTSAAQVFPDACVVEHPPPACPTSPRISTTSLSDQNFAPDEQWAPQPECEPPVTESEVFAPPIPDNDALPVMPKCSDSSRFHSQPPVTVLIPDTVRYDYRTPEPHWKGNFEILNVASADAFDGVLAYYASQIKQKAYEAAKILPEKLKMKIVKRLDVWPKIFLAEPPERDDIALSFLPKDDERSKVKFACLLERMDAHDLGMQCQVEKIKLLVFSSKQLPTGSQQLNGGFFLWGIFCQSHPDLVPSPAPPSSLQDILRARFHSPLLHSTKTSPSEQDDEKCRPCVSPPGTSLGSSSIQGTVKEKLPEGISYKAAKNSTCGTANRDGAATISDLAKRHGITFSLKKPTFAQSSPTNAELIAAGFYPPGFKKSSNLDAGSGGHASSACHSKWQEEPVVSKKIPLASSLDISSVATARDASGIHCHSGDKMPEQPPHGGWRPRSCKGLERKETPGNICGLQSERAPSSKQFCDKKSPGQSTSSGGWGCWDCRELEQKVALGNSLAPQCERAPVSRGPSDNKMAKQSAPISGWGCWDCTDLKHKETLRNSRSPHSEKAPDSWQSNDNKMPPQSTSSGGWKHQGCEDVGQKEALGTNCATQFERAPSSRCSNYNKMPRQSTSGGGWRHQHWEDLEQEALADRHAPWSGKAPSSRWPGDVSYPKQSTSSQGWGTWDGTKKSGHIESQGNVTIKSEPEDSSYWPDKCHITSAVTKPRGLDYPDCPPGFKRQRSFPSEQSKSALDAEDARQRKSDSFHRGFASAPKGNSHRDEY